jgi:hypothetical protein
MGSQGFRNTSDDIIVFGKTQAELDRSLDQTLHRLHANGPNKDKCLFSVPQLVFFGFNISAASPSPDDKNVEAIRSNQCIQMAKRHALLHMRQQL